MPTFMVCVGASARDSSSSLRRPISARCEALGAEIGLLVFAMTSARGEQRNAGIARPRGQPRLVVPPEPTSLAFAAVPWGRVGARRGPAWLHRALPMLREQLWRPRNAWRL